MSADRELLELAAKAAELHGFWVDAGLNVGSDAAPKIWNPLTDDGDALRLAVKLGIERIFVLRLGPNGICVDGAKEFATPATYVEKKWRVEFDSYAATRRAIVRAAAEIGKAMP